MSKSVLYIIALFCVLQSCSVFEEPEEFTFVNVGADYIIELSQTLETGINALLFNIQSTQINNCIESHIDVKTSVTDSELQLILGNIISQDPCIRIANQLESSAKFDLGIRNYNINISLQDVIQNYGTVAVSNESFTIELETENGIIIGQQKINIIPDGYVWGRVGVADIQNLAALKNVISFIKNATFKHDLKDGNYSFFEIRNSNIELPKNTDRIAAKEEFIFKQESDFDLLKNALSQFSEQYPSAKIEVYNSTGDSFVR